jgi:hypothetical protein
VSQKQRIKINDGGFMLKTRALSKSAKRTAATAGAGFFLANPLISAFLIGVGAVLWYSLKRRQNPGY